MAEAILVRNLASGMVGAPKFFRRNSSGWVAVSTPTPEDRWVGIGSRVWLYSNGMLGLKLLAFFWMGGEWWIFDGNSEIRICDVSARWNDRFSVFGVGLGELEIDAGRKKWKVWYILPSLRHAFEEGWDQTDVDIGWALNEYMRNSTARARLYDLLFGSMRVEAEGGGGEK